MSKINPNIFDDDWQLPEEQQIRPTHILNTDKPFEVQYKKYVQWYQQFIATSQRFQTDVFQTGVGFTNHPLIEVTQVNYEKNVGLFDIIKIESKSTQMFERTALLFTFLDNEVSKIKEQLESGPLDSLLLYGERAKDVQLAQGEAELQIGRSLGLFKQIYNLIKKLMSYVQHCILQLHCIMNKKDPNFKPLFKNNFAMHLLVKLIGRALKLIYVIDCLVKNNEHLLDHWRLYKTLIRVMKSQPQKFGITVAQAKSLERFATKLEGSLLSGKCFRIVLEMPYDQFFESTKSDLGTIKNNKELRQFLETFLIQNLKKVSEVIGTQKDKPERQFLLEILCVYAFFRRLYPSDDLRDLWKDAWSILRKVPILEGYGSTSVEIWTFLEQQCPLIRPSKSKDPKDINAYLQLFITKIDQNSQSDINALYTLLCVWLSRMQSLTTSNLTFSQPSSKQSADAILSDRILLLLHGLSVAGELRNTIYTLFSVHVSVGGPFSKVLLSTILLGLQSLKAIELTFKQKADTFDITLMNKVIGKQLYKIIKFNLDKVSPDELKKRPEKAQAYSSLNKVKQLLGSPITGLKLSIIKYSLAFSSGILLSEESYQEAMKQVRRLQQASQWHLIVRQLTNCSFLYGSRQILPFFFESKRNNPASCKRLQLMFNSFEDSGIMLQRPVHLSQPFELFLDYKEYVLNEFEQKYMIPLKRQLEDFLRINTHFMLLEKIQGQNPFKTETKDLLKLVHLQKLRIFDSLIDIKSQITRSLNQNFYNINALNMHDMETYQQIRNMGNYLFGLELQDAFLPSQTIEQGKFDIMKVLKNIPEFVEKYKYNIFTQTFLEVTTEAKQISSIGIKQLSDSIKTHGLGIMSTTVNAFYKFLAKKINLFNKFLYDELINSPLARQKNYLKNQSQKDDYAGYYPYVRAEAFYKQIKKLGKTEDDLTFMDKFRQLITSVGNVLGFVRLLRSASLRYSSKNVEFLPTKMDMNDEKLSDIAGRTNLSAPSIKTCDQLDDIFKSLEDSFSERADYLNIIVKGFSKIASKQNKHLKLFYLIVPALTINYIDNMMIGKEQINKKLSIKAFINDDGLLLGVAYFLALLKQQQHYQALHWDEAILAHFQSQIKQNKEFTRRTDKSQKINNDLNIQRQLSLRKLTMQFEEFEMMDHTLTAAKVLFRSLQKESPPAENPPAEKPAESQSQSTAADS